MRLRRLLLALVPLAIVLTACQSGAVLWGRCDPSGDRTGTDGKLAMVCTDGEWVPVMTVHEWVRVHAGESVDIAPLPERPAAPPTTAPVSAPPSTTPPTTTPVTVPAPSPPTILTVSPSSGDMDGGAAVTITGTGFTDTIEVTMGGSAVANMVVVDDSTITLSTLPHGSGPVDVVVTTPAGSATLVNGYVFA